VDSTGRRNTLITEAWCGEVEGREAKRRKETVGGRSCVAAVDAVTGSA